jgi:hypothetical protein
MAVRQAPTSHDEQAKYERSRARRKRLSTAQLKMLEDVRDYNDPWQRIHGSAAHGGAQSTLAFLLRRRFIRYDHEYGFLILPAGRAELSRR